MLESGDDSQQCGFTGAAFAEDGEEFPGGDFERDVAQDGVLAERLGDISDAQQR
jgi:hypothetical protein